MARVPTPATCSAVKGLLSCHCVCQLPTGHGQCRIQLAGAGDHAQRVRRILKSARDLRTAAGHRVPSERLTPLDQLPQKRRVCPHRHGHLQSQTIGTIQRITPTVAGVSARCTWRTMSGMRCSGPTKRTSGAFRTSGGGSWVSWSPRAVTCPAQPLTACVGRDVRRPAPATAVRRCPPDAAPSGVSLPMSAGSPSPTCRRRRADVQRDRLGCRSRTRVDFVSGMSGGRIRGAGA